MVRLTIRHVVLAGVAGAFTLGLVGCPSPFFARIKDEVAKAPFTASTYTFSRQFGNAHPEWSFDNPIVKTDSAGFIYVADYSFRIRKFNAAGVLQSTVGGVSTQGVNAKIYDMAFDSSGNMYVTTNDTKKVQKYDVNGNFVTSWGASTDLYGASNKALGTAYGIAVDSSGNVYVVDDTSSQYRVVKFNNAGSFIAEWGNASTYGGVTAHGGGTSPTFAFSGPTGIAADSTYIYVLDTGNHRIVKFDSSGAYQMDWGAAVSDTYGSIPVALSNPKSISVGVGSYSTYIFVVDAGNSRVVKFDGNGYYYTDWGNSTVFTSPLSVGIDTAGYVYVSDQGGGSFMHRVQKFDISSTPVVVASWATAAAADGLTVTPWGIAVDPSGNFITSELFNQRLEYFDSTGAFLKKVTLPGTASVGIAVNPSGNVYVAEIGQTRYQVVDSSGNVIATVGSAGYGDGQIGTALSLALDASGNVYVADNNNNGSPIFRVQIFTASGYFSSKWGSAGTGDGQFTAGTVYAIAVDPVNNWVYLSSYVDNKVVKFDLAGNYIMTLGTFGTGDGQFNAPIGMAVDPAGNVFVADMANHRVEKFNSSGAFLTKFGSAGAGNGGFGWPVGVAVNAKGEVAVTDYVGSLVQVFKPTFQ